MRAVLTVQDLWPLSALNVTPKRITSSRMSAKRVLKRYKDCKATNSSLSSAQTADLE